MDVIIYHNPACGTSRNTLAIIRASGTEPMVRVMVEARDPDQAKACAERIANTISG